MYMVIILKELEEIKKRMECSHYSSHYDDNFNNYSRTYSSTNENLSEYIMDIEDKTVLTVSSSGDHLLNMVGRGCKRVDTFDINCYSPFIQNLKIYAIKYLPKNLALKFLDKINNEIYFKFNQYLPKKEKDFFDYLFSNYNADYICYKLFYFSLKNNDNNNFFDSSTFDYIKKRLDEVKHNHYHVSLYQLSNYLNTLYDSIYLSNISYYVKNIDSFLNYINYLKNYLNSSGKIYYAYLYEAQFEDVKDAISNINLEFKKNFDAKNYKSIVANTEIVTVKSNSYDNKKDSILVLR